MFEEETVQPVKPSFIVAKGNKLLSAEYYLTHYEQRLILACIAQVDSGKNPKYLLTSDRAFEITVSNFIDLFSLNTNRAYEKLMLVVEKLYERSVIINNPDPDEPALKQTKTRWITSIDYIPDQGKVRLTFASKIIPYLQNLQRDGFNKCKLKNVSAMKSQYGIRLYELIIQWRPADGQPYAEREFSVEWLKKAFGIEKNTSYSRMSNFKMRVINPAMQDINNCSDFWIKSGQRKSGHAITHLQFRFGEKQSQQTPVEPTKLSTPHIPVPTSPQQSPEEEAFISSVAVYKINRKNAIAAIKMHGLDDAIEICNYAILDIKRRTGTTNEVRSAGAYLAECLREGHGKITSEERAAKAKQEAEKLAAEEKAKNTRILKQLEEEVVRNRKQQLKTLIAELSPQHEKELKDKFIQNGLPDLMRSTFEQKGWKGVGIMSVYRMWLDRELLCPIEDYYREYAAKSNLDYDALIASQGMSK